MTLLDKLLIEVFGFQYEGYELWSVKNTQKVEALIKPNWFFDVDNFYNIRNQNELRDLINDLPYGWGLYDPHNEAYVLTGKFIFYFDENKNPDQYSVELKRCVL